MADTSVIANDEDDDLGVVLTLGCACGCEYPWRVGLEEPPHCPRCGPDDDEPDAA